MGEDGTLESWEYQGGSFTAAGSWLPVGGKKFSELDKVLGLVEGKAFDYSSLYKATSSTEVLNGEEFVKIQCEALGRVQYTIESPKTNKLFSKFLIYSESTVDINVQIFDDTLKSYIVNQKVTLKSGYNIVPLESTNLVAGNRIIVYIGKSEESSTFFIARKTILYYDLYKPSYILKETYESLISKINDRITGVTGNIFFLPSIEYTGKGSIYDHLTVAKLYIEPGTYTIRANNFNRPDDLEYETRFYVRGFLKSGAESPLGYCSNSIPKRVINISEDVEYIELRFYVSETVNSQVGFKYVVENASFNKGNDIEGKLENIENKNILLESDIDNLSEITSSIYAEFSDSEVFVVDKQNYSSPATSTFGDIYLTGLEKRICTLYMRSDDLFHFAVYGYRQDDTYEIIKDFPDGTDFSKGISIALNIKELIAKEFNRIKIRTYEIGVVIDYSLSYNKKTLTNVLSLASQWNGSIVALFGNSITAQCNGDYEYEFNNSWGGIFAQNVKLHKLFARGVGGQTYKWNDGAYYCKAGGTGGYVNRYKVQDGQISTSAGQVSVTTTEEEKQAIEAVLGYSIEIHRGCFCSWDRITSMFPPSIKNTIQAVCIMGGTNDFSGVEEIESSGADGSLEPLWSAENQTDTDWKNAEGYYNGGDYDVTNTWGGMASCLMKMQVWMPQAKIIVLVPITRKGVNFNVPVNSVGATHQDLCQSVKSVADWCNVETIDMNCCGINQFNIDAMLSDGVHPSSNGQKRMGQYLAVKFNTMVKFVE